MLLYIGNKEIQDLMVKCDNADFGCQWVGELRSLKDHKAACTLVPCPHKCDQRVLQKDLETHLNDDCPERDYRCPHCDEQGKYSSITGPHLKECLEVPVQCPNEGCEEKISSLLVTFHMSTECEFQLVECKYKAIGCSERMMKKDIEEHERNLELHLQHIVFAIRDLRGELRKFKDIPAASIPFEDVLKDQLETESSPLQPKISELQAAQKAMQDDIKELKDKLRVKESVFPSITFKVADILRGFNPGTCCSSVPFYSSECGYKLCVCVYPNENNYVKVQIHLMQGEFDDRLNWPYGGKLKIELLNQKMDSNHYSKEVNFSREAGRRVRGTSKNPIGCGTDKFIHRKHLFPSVRQRGSASRQRADVQYVVDAVAFFRVTATVPKSWLECSPLDSRAATGSSVAAVKGATGSAPVQRERRSSDAMAAESALSTAAMLAYLSAFNRPYCYFNDFDDYDDYYSYYDSD